MILLPPLRSPFLPALRSPFDVANAIRGATTLTERVRRALFSSGEQGGMWDATDMATLFQDSAGTTPVTAVSQPIGLMLDKSQGLVLGSELVANGTFDAGTTGWIAGNSASLSVVGQKLRVQHDGVNYPFAAYNIPTVAGKTYRVHFSVTRGTSPDGIGLRVYNLSFGGGGAQLSDSKYKTASGDYVCVFKAVSSTSHIYFIVNTETVGTYDDVDKVSVREIPGNHASQPTTTARPHLYDSPLRIEYDGVDDYLRTTFPALGSNVTIARSIPGTGAQILTGQTIAAGNWDDNVDSCATLVIDRALTGPETALVTAFLNQQAGV